MSQDISNVSVENNFFWENSTFHPNFVKELRRRKNSNNVGINYTDFDKHLEYKGPMTSWSRVFSCGTGKAKNSRIPRSGFLTQESYEGLILDGGSGFLNSYGISDPKSTFTLPTGKIRIGKDRTGQDVYIDNNDLIYGYSSAKSHSPMGLPSPGITSINIIEGKDFYTKTDVNFTCFGLAQLEFLIPFFLTPGIYVFVEFGWNLFNSESLLDLGNISDLRETRLGDENFDVRRLLTRFYNSYGNYGLVSGIITDFDIKITGNQRYDCSFTVQSPQFLFAGSDTTNRATIDGKFYVNIKNDIINYLDIVLKSVIEGKNLLLTDPSQPFPPNIGEFYKKQPEDRIFCGRNQDLFKNNQFTYEIKGDINKPTRFQVDSHENFYLYLFNEYNVYSNKKDNDFDAGDNKDTDIWLQLDFVFEFLNLFFPVEFNVDISSTIISGHPNLISCNKNVLIPNSIAPKINKGNYPGTATKINEYWVNNYDNISEKDKLYKSFEKARKVFKMNRSTIITDRSDEVVLSGFARENLDEVINYIYYNKNKKARDCSFPSKSDIIIGSNKYEKYKFGYLKNIYFNKNKLKSIISDSENIKQILDQILNELNDSVNNFWKLDVVQNKDGNGCQIIDKSINNLKECYQFEVGTQNSFVKEIDFSVKLSDAQSLNVLFSSGINKPDNENSIDSNENSIVNVSFYDIFENTDSSDKKNIIPKEESSTLSLIQSVDPNLNSLGILRMSFKATFQKNSYTDIDKVPDHVVCLNMNSDMKDILSSLLDDGDFKNNKIYANIADNFVLNLKLDGIFGIKIMDNFSISNLPKPYSPENIVFQVNEVSHAISDNGKWETNVSALVKGVYNDNSIEYISI